LAFGSSPVKNVGPRASPSFEDIYDLYCLPF
jgi:hypothetical protein